MSATRCLRGLALLLSAGALSCNVGAVSSCSHPPAGGASWLEIQPLPIPEVSPSAQPQLTAAPDGGVVVSWLESRGEAHRFRLARLRHDHQGWEAPITIHEGRDFFANWADVPSVAATEGLIAAHWLQKSGPDTYAYDVKVRTSRDDGETWSEPFSPHTDGTKTEHGFASFFPWSGGALAIAWLDGRELTGADSRKGEMAGVSGQMTLRAAPIDHGAAGAEMLVDGRVCDCCPTAAVRTSRGIVLTYRDRTADEIRDIYVTRFENGRWSEGTPVWRDNWQIAGCPVNGPAISARSDRVALAWFAAPAEGRVSVAFSDDGGVSFDAPIRVDDGRPLGRTDVEMLDDGRALVGWIEQVDDGAEFRLSAVSSGGERSAPVVVARLSASRASGYPRIARSGERLVFAWVEGGRVQAALGTLRQMPKARRLGVRLSTWEVFPPVRTAPRDPRAWARR
jgi:hypothetical protein